ncbi:MAG: hypothetical protein LBI96_04130, partial [Odoribacteraceae bacterium]|nr:hypothetical protein [Odoribacteraceae bacterium]
PQTRACQPKARAFQPKTRAFEPKTRAFEPTTRAFEPKTRAFEPKARAFEPKTRAFEPKTRTVTVAEPVEALAVVASTSSATGKAKFTRENRELSRDNCSKTRQAPPLPQEKKVKNSAGHVDIPVLVRYSAAKNILLPP